MLMIPNQEQNGKDDDLLYYSQLLQIKQYELETLLDISKAINENISEEDLYKVYGNSIRPMQDIDGLALYVLEDGIWSSKVHFGTEKAYDASLIDKEIKGIDVITFLDKNSDSELAAFFEVVIPIKHKSNVLAYVFISVIGDHLELAKDYLPLIQIISNLVLVAIENKRFARKQLLQEAMKKELQIAQQVQNLLFPKKLPSTHALQIKAAYYPHKQVGGDYYDYIPLEDNRFMVCIADVSGKGIPAAMIMSNFQASLRALVLQGLEFIDIIKGVNGLIRNNGDGDYFITFFGAIIDPNNKVIHYVNAGHNPPMLFKNGKVLFLDKGTTVLGVFEELPFINEGIVDYKDEAFIYAYTDGLTEAQNANEEEYGDENLMYFIMKNIDKADSNLNQLIKENVDEHRGDVPYHDDVTMLSCWIR
jgi:sigma-B regulation protein RsbU (phosphoserine phosphatase)